MVAVRLDEPRRRLEQLRLGQTGVAVVHAVVAQHVQNARGDPLEAVGREPRRVGRGVRRLEGHADLLAAEHIGVLRHDLLRLGAELLPRLDREGRGNADFRQI